MRLPSWRHPKLQNMMLGKVSHWYWIAMTGKWGKYMCPEVMLTGPAWFWWSKTELVKPVYACLSVRGYDGVVGTELRYMLLRKVSRWYLITMTRQWGKHMCPEGILTGPTCFEWPKTEVMKPRYAPLTFWDRGWNVHSKPKSWYYIRSWEVSHRYWNDTIGK